MQYRTHDDGPLVDISIEPGLVRISMLFDREGCHARTHAHTFDHPMLVVHGPVRITVDGVVSIKRTGETYLVEAGQQHSVVPLVDNARVDCLHYHADIHPDRMDGAGIPAEWLHRLTTVPPMVANPVWVPLEWPEHAT